MHFEVFQGEIIYFQIANIQGKLHTDMSVLKKKNSHLNYIFASFEINKT